MAERLDRLPALLQSPGRVIAWRGEVALDAAALSARIAAWQRVLAPFAGQRIALRDDDAVEFVAALYAAWLCEAEVVVVADALPATLAHLRGTVQVFAGDFGAEVPCMVAGNDSPDDDSVQTALPRGLEHRLLLYTSGSSGAPTLVPKSLRQLDAEVQTLEATFGTLLDADATTPVRISATVSHLHIYGLLLRLLWPLAAGRPFDACTHPYIEGVAALAARESLALVSSPAHLKRWPLAPQWPAATPCSGLRAVFSSGGPLPLAAAQQVAAATGLLPLEVYGSTETGGIAWRLQVAADTPWTPLAGVQVRADADGALRLQSPHLADHGWLVLTDRGHCMADGRLQLLGRADRIVKLEEQRVSLDALEQVVCTTCWASEARALLLDGPRAALGLVVVPTDDGLDVLRSYGRATLVEYLRSALRTVVERSVLPRRMRFVSALPVNRQGKTTLESLLALCAGAQARPLLPFHRWQRREPDAAELELLISPDLHHLQGHFPGQPIVPGVAQIDWAIAFAREAFALPSTFLGMDVLKFQQTIAPGCWVTLSLQWDAGRGMLGMRIASVTGQHASARLRFGPAG